MRQHHLIRDRLVALVDGMLSHHRDFVLQSTLAPSQLDHAQLDGVPGLTAGDSRILGDVIDALERLDEGTYGSCAGCGDAIGDERLLERPAVALCPRCASEDSWRPFGPR